MLQVTRMIRGFVPVLFSTNSQTFEMGKILRFTIGEPLMHVRTLSSLSPRVSPLIFLFSLLICISVSLRVFHLFFSLLLCGVFCVVLYSVFCVLCCVVFGCVSVFGCVGKILMDARGDTDVPIVCYTWVLRRKTNRTISQLVPSAVSLRMARGEQCVQVKRVSGGLGGVLFSTCSRN